MGVSSCVAVRVVAFNECYVWTIDGFRSGDILDNNGGIVDVAIGDDVLQSSRAASTPWSWRLVKSFFWS
jgi:hypothetical protein